MKTNKSSVMKSIRPYLAHRKMLIAVSILFSAASVVLSLYLPRLVGNAIDLMTAKNRVDFDGIGKIVVTAAAVIAATALLQWLTNIINNKIVFEVVSDIRCDGFRHIQSLPLSYLDTHKTGETVNRLISDADQFADGLLLGFTQLFSGLTTIAVTIGLMISINTAIALTVIVLTPISIFVAKFIAKRSFDLFKKQSEQQAELTALTEEMIGNQKLVKSYSYEERALDRFGKINHGYLKIALKATFFSSLTNPTTRFINSLIYAVVGVVGALFAISGGITVGAFVSLLSYANQYTKPFNEISGVITELQNAFACAERLFELINSPVETPDSSDSEILANANGNIDIENVSFSYSPERPLIENLNLATKSGQRIALVGPTGCGKTTVINLLMRFYDVDKGSISIDGTNIKNITRRSLRTSYGMVLQETWIKNATVRENIAIGKPGASDEEIIAAAKAAYAHNFIEQLPNGYDTVIGGDDSGLSEGQKQLLCIARVMISRPDMLILDEATSSIDTRTEQKIQAAFQKLMSGHTSFIVAHRLSTIRSADIILVMKDGNIIEKGNHKELLKLHGFYYNLYNSQFE